jgi:hypothetical protein
MQSYLWTFAVLAFWFSGCHGTPPQEPQTGYEFGFFNATGQELGPQTLDWQTGGVPHRTGGAILVPGGGATRFYDSPLPMPEAATVSWTTADGRPHKQEVQIAKSLPKGKEFAGTIWLKFTDEGVVVVPMTYEERHRLALEKKPTVPQ